MMADWLFDWALLPDGWARNVAISVTDGVIDSVVADADPAGHRRVAGLAIPGLANVHSHAFQRAMAGLAEVRGPAHDSFWTWREVMYRFLGRLSPDDVEAIAAFAFAEMLEAGFTALGEFHYLHHAPDGRPYGDIAELSARIVEAARETGIGLTLLPVFYANGGFGGAPFTDGQKRFATTPDAFARLVDGARRAVATLPDARLGIAPHSLRAVTPDSLAEVLPLAGDGPIHIHAAEQTREVDDCLAWSGRRPVEWLLAEAGVDRRWCLIHATHMGEAETDALAASGAVAGLCPLTEASLGDGIFPAARFVEKGGAFAVGSDSNIEITAAGELKQLEYDQRLSLRERNVLAPAEGASTGRSLYEAALAGGRQALGRKIGVLAPGNRADIAVLDATLPDFAAAGPERWLDSYVFVTGRGAVERVIVGGETVVENGRHVARDRIESRYVAALIRLTND